MKVFKKIISFIVFALIFFFGLTVHAFDNNLALEANLDNSQLNVSVGAGLNTATPSNTPGDLPTATGTTTNNSNVSSNGSASNGSMSGNGSIGFSLSRNDLANLHIDLNAAASSTPDMISTDADLSSYAAASMNSDDHIEKVSSQDNQVKMKYRESAKFLGFIPGKISTNVVVDSDGSVHVRYPWYRFLMKTGQSRADLEAQIKANLGSGFSGENGAAFSAQTKAEIIAAIRSAMMRVRDNMNADANARVNGSASVGH
jgi:hypothetical protein